MISPFGGMFATVKAMLTSRKPSAEAQANLDHAATQPHGPMAQLGLTVEGKPLKRDSEAVEAGAA